MPRPYASGVVPASADEVWSVVRDFADFPGWHPGATASTLLSGASGAEVGAVRSLTVGGGGTVVERLVTLDDAARTYSYEIVESPFGMRRYVSTMRVAPVTDTGHAFVEWSAEFDADAEAEESLLKTFSGGVYAGGIAALQKRFAG